MNRMELKKGLYTQITEAGEIPLLDDYVKSARRFGLSNPNKKIFFPPPQIVREKRSNQQNRAVVGYWMDVIMKEEYGEPYTKSEKLKVYNELKIEMGWVVEKVNRKTGEVRLFPKDTHDLDKEKYSNWMESFARHIAVNHNINLPDPVRSLAVI